MKADSLSEQVQIETCTWDVLPEAQMDPRIGCAPLADGTLISDPARHTIAIGRHFGLRSGDE